MGKCFVDQARKEHTVDKLEWFIIDWKIGVHNPKIHDEVIIGVKDSLLIVPSEQNVPFFDINQFNEIMTMHFDTVNCVC